jgi:hypothetical protein
MLRSFFVSLALLIGVISILLGDEPGIELIGEPQITVDSSYTFNPPPLGYRDFYEIREPIPGDPNLNAITKEPLYNYPEDVHFAVGDMGKVYKISGGGYILNSWVLLNGEYNFTGVSFAPFAQGYGWIVGYKRTDPKWQGIILKTTDGGQSWTQQTNITPPFDIPTPFLDVHAVNQTDAWISCGHGYVLRTTNGGANWYQTPAKPGDSDNFDWLWGILAYDEITAWVCSDQSGLVAIKSYLK